MTEAPPKESRCASGHRIEWRQDGKGLTVFRMGREKALVTLLILNRECWEMRCCPACGAAILPVA